MIDCSEIHTRTNDNATKYFICTECSIGRISVKGDVITRTKECFCIRNPHTLLINLGKQKFKLETSNSVVSNKSLKKCHSDVRNELDSLLPNNEQVNTFPNFYQLHAAASRSKTKFEPPQITSFETIPQQLPGNFKYLNVVDANQQENEVKLWNLINEEYINPVNNAVERILAFGTEASLTKLFQQEEIALDGTFYTAPYPFTQIVSVHSLLGIENDNKMCVVRLFFLLPRKTKHCYVRAFQCLFERYPELSATRQWQRIRIDFETGLLGLASDFLHLQVLGCHYYFCACLYRHISEGHNNLRAEYKEDNSKVKKLLKYLMALVFVKPVDVRITLAQILSDPNVCHPTLAGFPKMIEFIQYFMNNWIHPDEKLLLSNVFDRDDRRTINDVEGFNRQLQEYIKPATGFWSCLHGMKQVFKDHHRDEVCYLNNASKIRPRRKFYRRREAFLKHAKEMYSRSEVSALDYVTAIYNHMAEFG